MTISKHLGRPQPNPYKIADVATTGSNPNLLLGCELEIERCPYNGGTYEEILKGLGWNITTDNSLRGDNIQRAGTAGEIAGHAYEFVSEPMQQSTLLHSLREFFRKTEFSARNYTDRTSVHIHVNCLDLTYDQLSSVALLYTVVEEVLFKFVGNNRENNIYCIPWYMCRLNYDIVAKMEANSIDTIRRWQKYTALNLLPIHSQGTVEFRHMHGTADIDKLTTWINLIGSIFAYATATELTALINEIKELNSTSEYDVFFHKVLGGYLEYNDDYRASLEAGVIVAKYGLINWKKEKKAEVPIEGGIAMNTVYLDPVVEFAPNAAPTIRPQRFAEGMPEWASQAAHAGRPMGRGLNRFSPWPPVGTTVDVGRDMERTSLAEAGTLQSTPHSWRHNPGSGMIMITGADGSRVRPAPIFMDDVEEEDEE